MPIREVLSAVEPRPDAFDVVIVDEASQADLTSLFLLWLAPRVIVVGDDRQCTPADVGVGSLEPAFARLETDLPEVPFYLRSQFTPRASVFSVFRATFGPPIRLREHFRSMPEIVGWSSREFYSGPDDAGCGRAAGAAAPVRRRPAPAAAGDVRAGRDGARPGLVAGQRRRGGGARRRRRALRRRPRLRRRDVRGRRAAGPRAGRADRRPAARAARGRRVGGPAPAGRRRRGLPGRRARRRLALDGRRAGAPPGVADRRALPPGLQRRRLPGPRPDVAVPLGPRRGPRPRRPAPQAPRARHRDEPDGSAGAPENRPAPGQVDRDHRHPAFGSLFAQRVFADLSALRVRRRPAGRGARAHARPRRHRGERPAGGGLRRRRGARRAVDPRRRRGRARPASLRLAGGPGRGVALRHRPEAALAPVLEAAAAAGITPVGADRAARRRRVRARRTTPSTGRDAGAPGARVLGEARARRPSRTSSTTSPPRASRPRAARPACTTRATATSSPTPRRCGRPGISRRALAPPVVLDPDLAEPAQDRLRALGYQVFTSVADIRAHLGESTER